MSRPPGSVPHRSLASLAAVLMLCATGVATFAAADTITVVTSFPKELTSAYKTAYEKKYPGDKVEILNKGTSAGIAYVREQPAGSRPEIFWASAPDAFEVLAGEAAAEGRRAQSGGIPDKIGNYPINDPEGFYRGQALAGYGIMWNTRYLQANKLPAPKEWADLVKPVYFGHVATSSPVALGHDAPHVRDHPAGRRLGRRAGTRSCRSRGNCAAITERSFGVPDGVQNGQFGIGLVIDFFGLAAKNSGFPVDFAYPSVTAIVPANIALVAGAKSPEAGKRFMQFTLSEEGQQLLLDPKISRLPVLPATYAKAPPGYPNPFDGTIKAKVNFDSNLSESRYYVVVLAVRPGHHVPPQGAASRRPRRSRTPRSAWAARPSPQLEEAKKLAWTLAGRREAGEGQGAARDLQGEEG